MSINTHVLPAVLAIVLGGAMVAAQPVPDSSDDNNHSPITLRRAREERGAGFTIGLIVAGVAVPVCGWLAYKYGYKRYKASKQTKIQSQGHEVKA
jgi:hypothetical protein